MGIQKARVGDKVVFAKEKFSDSPGRRAQEISAATKGDSYSYIVEKYWVVKEINPDGSLVLMTRRGKDHTVSATDPRLRRPTLFERILLRRRFPSLNTPESGSDGAK